MKLQSIKTVAQSLALALCLVLLSGCIRHRVRITSEPSQAMVTWNEKYYGRTPIEIMYNWHWKYTVGIEREGYQMAEDVVFLRTRPWFIEPLYFFFEALPFRFTDTRSFHYQLEPLEEEAAL